MSWFTANPDGTYSHRSAVLGGCGGGTQTAAEMADFLAKVVFDHPGVLQQLEALGWTDVLALYREILAGREREKRIQRIAELRKTIAYAEPLYAEGRHNDPGYWVEKIIAEKTADPEFNPDDFSLGRTHQAARSAMGLVATLPRLKAELAELLTESHDGPGGVSPIPDNPPN
jgi:hypothetical protein